MSDIAFISVYNSMVDILVNKFKLCLPDIHIDVALVQYRGARLTALPGILCGP